MKKYRHLFFDLDRTLWDMDKNSRAALSELYDLHGLQEAGIPSFDDFFAFYEPYNHHLWERYQNGTIDKTTLRFLRFEKSLSHFGVKNEELVRKMSDGYIQTAPRKTELVDGTIDLLDYLSGKRYVIHILTNGFEEVQQFKVDHCGLRSYITELITSDRAGFLKPDARMFDFALQVTGANISESIMIGDSLDTDIAGARSFGMDTVFFNLKEEASLGKPTYEIRSLMELKNLL